MWGGSFLSEARQRGLAAAFTTTVALSQPTRVPAHYYCAALARYLHEYEESIDTTKSFIFSSEILIIELSPTGGLLFDSYRVGRKYKDHCYIQNNIWRSLRTRPGWYIYFLFDPTYRRLFYFIRMIDAHTITRICLKSRYEFKYTQ